MNKEFMKIFLITLFVMIALRLLEMFISRSNEKILLKDLGLKLVKPYEHYGVYVFHVVWFVSFVWESLAQQEIQSGFFALICYVFLVLAQIIRFESMQTLGVFWTTKIYSIPKKDVIVTGLYRYLAHPSYLAVIIEFIALPLLFHAYYTMI